MKVNKIYMMSLWSPGSMTYNQGSISVGQYILATPA